MGTYSKGKSLPLKRNVSNRIMNYLHSKFAISITFTHREIMEVADNALDAYS